MREVRPCDLLGARSPDSHQLKLQLLLGTHQELV